MSRAWLAIGAIGLLAGGWAARGAEPAPPPEFAPCAACHNAAPDALGPDLTGVVGRTAGTVPGFRYSGPLKRSGLVWTPQTLRAWLIDPQATVPGNRMPYSGASPEDADRIVAWLARHQAP